MTAMANAFSIQRIVRITFCTLRQVGTRFATLKAFMAFIIDQGIARIAGVTLVVVWAEAVLT
jgi:hypothetical protein